ncbi:MAG: ferrochelatase [Candidatus Latescibacterota bacterium]|jgi:ferrochelatase
MSQVGILMMAYGSPESLDDMAAYLNDIRGGRPMSPEFVEEFRGRYAQIGGKSPLNELTFAQGEATQAELQKRGVNAKVYVGMRHWTPWIKDAVADMHADGVTDAVAIVMAPHYSRMSIGRYWQKVNEAQEAIGSAIRFKFVDSWSREEKLLDAQLAKTKSGLAKFDTGDPVKVVFSAHSLPARLKEMGDPYDDELQDNAKTLAERLGQVDWMFSYQSAAKTGEPWLGPQIEDVIPDLAQAGYTKMLSVPIGFVCDHVEVLYDIDIGCQEIAQKHGVHLERVEMMNCDPLFIGAVADAIEKAMDK